MYNEIYEKNSGILSLKNWKGGGGVICFKFKMALKLGDVAWCYAWVFD